MIGQGHKTAVCGTTIAWREMGKGRPLVLLHGLYDSHRTWRRAAPLLARRYHVFMPDLAGFGWSGRPDAPYTLTWHAQVIADWMGAIGVEKAHLCGHSFGGGIAQWMVLEQRRRIDRLALVCPGGLGRGVTAGMRFATFPFFGPLITPLVLRHIMPAVLRRYSDAFGHIEPDEIERFVAWTRIPGSERAFQRSVEGVINLLGQHVQTIHRASEVTDMPPVAMFWGTQDPIVPTRHGRNAAKYSDGITLTLYDECGHFPHLDFPDRFAADLVEFLRDPARRPARVRPVPLVLRLLDQFRG